MENTLSCKRGESLNANWSHFPHGADVGVRGEGPTLEEAFAAAAMALTSVVTKLERVEARETVHVRCEAPERDLLLMEWLNSVIYEMDVRKMLFSEFTVTIAGNELRAELRGERVDRARHDPAVEVKGATLTELKVNQHNGAWLAQCVIDV